MQAYYRKQVYVVYDDKKQRYSTEQNISRQCSMNVFFIVNRFHSRSLLVKVD